MEKGRSDNPRKAARLQREEAALHAEAEEAFAALSSWVSQREMPSATKPSFQLERDPVEWMKRQSIDDSYMAMDEDFDYETLQQPPASPRGRALLGIPRAIQRADTPVMSNSSRKTQEKSPPVNLQSPYIIPMSAKTATK